MTYRVTCHDPARAEDFTDEREVSLQRVRWLDRHVGGDNWSQDLEWDFLRGLWIHHYDLDCSAALVMLFKLTWG